LPGNIISPYNSNPPVFTDKMRIVSITSAKNNIQFVWQGSNGTNGHETKAEYETEEDKAKA